MDNLQFEKISTSGQVSSQFLPIDYVENILNFFHLLRRESKHAILLESASIEERNNLKSIMLIDAALKIEANGELVEFTALSDNGAALLPFIKKKIVGFEIDLKDRKLSARLIRLNKIQNEEQRLQQINQFSALRLLINELQPISNEQYAVFLAGLFSYEMLHAIENLPSPMAKENTAPDFCFYLAETLLEIDHSTKSARLVANLFSQDQKTAENLSLRLVRLQPKIAFAPALKEYELPKNLAEQVDIADKDFEKLVLKAKEYIDKGDVFQLVLSRTIKINSGDPLAAYSKLKNNNPSPYMFFMLHPDFVIFGSSPESSLKFTASTRMVEIYPIAGTRKRGLNADGTINLDLDNKIELELRQDEKELAEHIMLVDLARNDLAKICQTGSRYVKKLMMVDKYSKVMHLVSVVVGKLKVELDALHAYQAVMNMGTLTGSPKLRASEIIIELENKRRGSYGGAIGYFTGSGDFDSCIVIRSAFVKDNIAYIQSGAGIVYDSNPKSEAEETKAKAAAVLQSFL